jgi:hypothetical protein
MHRKLWWETLLVKVYLRKRYEENNKIDLREYAVNFGDEINWLRIVSND